MKNLFLAQKSQNLQTKSWINNIGKTTSQNNNVKTGSNFSNVLLNANTSSNNKNSVVILDNKALTLSINDVKNLLNQNKAEIFVLKNNQLENVTKTFKENSSKIEQLLYDNSSKTANEFFISTTLQNNNKYASETTILDPEKTKVKVEDKASNSNETNLKKVASDNLLKESPNDELIKSSDKNTSSKAENVLVQLIISEFMPKQSSLEIETPKTSKSNPESSILKDSKNSDTTLEKTKPDKSAQFNKEYPINNIQTNQSSSKSTEPIVTNTKTSNESINNQDKTFSFVKPVTIQQNNEMFKQSSLSDSVFGLLNENQNSKVIPEKPALTILKQQNSKENKIPESIIDKNTQNITKDTNPINKESFIKPTKENITPKTEKTPEINKTNEESSLKQDASVINTKVQNNTQNSNSIESANKSQGKSEPIKLQNKIPISKEELINTMTSNQVEITVESPKLEPVKQTAPSSINRNFNINSEKNDKGSISAKVSNEKEVVFKSDLISSKENTTPQQNSIKEIPINPNIKESKSENNPKFEEHKPIKKESESQINKEEKIVIKDNLIKETKSETKPVYTSSQLKETKTSFDEIKTDRPITHDTPKVNITSEKVKTDEKPILTTENKIIETKTTNKLSKSELMDNSNKAPLTEQNIKTTHESSARRSQASAVNSDRINNNSPIRNNSPIKDNNKEDATPNKVEIKNTEQTKSEQINIHKDKILYTKSEIISESPKAPLSNLDIKNTQGNSNPKASKLNSETVIEEKHALNYNSELSNQNKVNTSSVPSSKENQPIENTISVNSQIKNDNFIKANPRTNNETINKPITSENNISKGTEQVVEKINQVTDSNNSFKTQTSNTESINSPKPELVKNNKITLTAISKKSEVKSDTPELAIKDKSIQEDKPVTPIKVSKMDKPITLEVHNQESNLKSTPDKSTNYSDTKASSENITPLNVVKQTVTEPVLPDNQNKFSAKLENNSYTKPEMNEMNNQVSSSYSTENKVNTPLSNPNVNVAQAVQSKDIDNVESNFISRVKGNEFMKSQIQDMENNVAMNPEINMIKEHIETQKPLFLKYTDNEGQQKLQTVLISNNANTNSISEQKSSNLSETNSNSIKEPITKSNTVTQVNENRNQSDSNPGSNNKESFSDFNQQFTSFSINQGVEHNSTDNRYFMNEFSIKIQDTINQLKNNQKNQSAKFEFEINEVGSVKTVVEKKGEGLSIKFETESIEKSEMLKDSLANLESNLKEQGYTQVNIEYNFSNQTKEDQSQSSSQRPTKNRKVFEKEVNLENQEQNEPVMKNYGYNSVEYVI